MSQEARVIKIREIRDTDVKKKETTEDAKEHKKDYHQMNRMNQIKR